MVGMSLGLKSPVRMEGEGYVGVFSTCLFCGSINSHCSALLLPTNEFGLSEQAIGT